MSCCDRCGRPISKGYGTEYPDEPGDHIVIDHGYYGCDTGCCGLEATLVKSDLRGGHRILFDFMHDEEAFVEGIKRLHPDIPIRVFCWYCPEWSDRSCKGDN